MQKLVSIVLVLSLMLQADSQRRGVTRQDARCTTPNRQGGTCISIKQCQPLLDLLRRDKDKPGVADFLRRSGCGYDFNAPSVPKVCCPLSMQQQTGGTNTPAVRPTQGQQGVSQGNDPYPNLPSPPQCGRTDILDRDRIINGQPAALGAWPWIAALGYRSSTRPGPNWLCGGALITNRYIVTAAHCTRHPTQTLYMARLGDLDLNGNVRDGATPVDRLIERALAHESYSTTKLTDDIALLRLKETVPFSKLIQPICLPKTQELRTKDYTPYSPYVAGWGSIQFRGPSSTALLEVQLPVVDQNICRTAYRKKGAEITNKQLCAGYDDGSKDACQGDSGGPMMWPKGLNFYLIGVVSYGFRCAEPGYPGIYTRVTEYIDWISKNIT